MLRKFKYIILFAALAACERVENPGTGLIGVSAGTGDFMSATRANAVPFKGTVPSEDNPLESTVWFSTEMTRFMHNPVAPTYLPCHTGITFESSAITYADYIPEGSNTPYSLTYPIDNTPVYCVGFHPADGWNCTDGINVTHPINGSEDLMFAEPIMGTWDQHFNTLNYKHQLTWIKVSVSAMTMETASQWGKVTNVTIKSRSSLNIDLSNNAEKVSYGGEYQVMTVYDDPAGLSLNLTSQEVGSVFCAPETEYEISIKTENSVWKVLTVKLSDLDYKYITSPDQAVGKLFILSLYFNPFNVIEGTCTLNYWNDQNEDLFLTPPSDNQ